MSKTREKVPTTGGIKPQKQERKRKKNLAPQIPRAQNAPGQTAASGALSPDAVRQLQQTAGNQAVNEMLGQKKPPEKSVNPPHAADAGIADAGSAPAAQTRQDYVFIMGQDRPKSGNEFYKAAGIYFKTEYPSARIVSDIRTLEGVLSYISTNVTEPIGNIYIVTHANEDGTLSFALDDEDVKQPGKKPEGDRGDSKITLRELEKALEQGSLTRLGEQVDDQTTIYIKGCNIGQNPEMVEALDKTFGGQGTVVAPTHKQHYSYTSTTTKKKGEKKPTTTYEAQETLVDPQIERPGTQQFDEEEITDIVNRRYGHLSEKERKNLIRQFSKQQRINRRIAYVESSAVPKTDKQARAVFSKEMRAAGFRPDPKKKVQITFAGGVYTYQIFDKAGGSRIFTIPVSDQATLIEKGKAATGNPQDYTWAVEEKRKGSQLKQMVVGTRVLSALKRDLNPPGGQFSPPYSSTTFYTQSTYKPPVKPVKKK
ncbi:MAG: hypothetical protein GXY36_15700 [Chloroflexi bacterium]|nr:hypothetical protein [Chloroflexota bacterium]